MCQLQGDDEGPRDCRLTTKGIVYLSKNSSTIKRKLLNSKYDVGSKLEELLDIISFIPQADEKTTPPPGRNNNKKINTEIGIAVEANETEIKLAIAGLIFQIDAKLEALRNELPNSEEAISALGAQVAEYEQMRAELEGIRGKVEAFMKGIGKEEALVKSMTSFAEGTKLWWNKSHDSILTKAFDMGVFTTSVGICSMAGAGGKMAVVVSAVLAGGKPVAQALRDLVAKRFIAD